MTIRTSFFGPLVAGERAETRVPLALAAAQAHPERRHRDRYEVTEAGDERQQGDDDGSQAGRRSRSRRSCPRGSLLP